MPLIIKKHPKVEFFSRTYRENIVITYEMNQDKDSPTKWRVEAVNSKTGDIFVTVFGCADAEIRAREYVAWKSSQSSNSKVA